MSQAGREPRAASVIDKNGVRAEVEFAYEENSEGEARVLVRTAEGVNYLVPAATLVGLKDGGYFLPLSLRDLTPNNAVDNGNAAGFSDESFSDEGGEALVVPVVAEELIVGKRVVESGRVRITKTISEREQIVDEPLQSEEATVERVAVNRVVDAPPPVRYEGDVMIVPLVEEMLVVERRLVVREELRISKRLVEVHDPQRVVLRREEAKIERVEPHNEPGEGSNAGDHVTEMMSAADNTPQ